MLEPLPELAAELLPLVAYTLGATLLTALGVLAELRSATELAAGLDPTGLWLAAMGALALYAGLYQIGYREVLPRALGRDS